MKIKKIEARMSFNKSWPSGDFQPEIIIWATDSFTKGEYLTEMKKLYKRLISFYQKEYGFKNNKKDIIRKGIDFRTKWEVFKRDNFKCVKCGSDMYLEVDHKRPISKGGKNIIDNFQTLCKFCNIAKRDKL